MSEWEGERKRRKWAVISCRFCRTFREGGIFDKVKGHYCKLASKWVQSNDEGCHRFDLNPVFICPKYEQVVFIENCLYRRANKKIMFGDYGQVCPKCQTGKQLYLFINNGNIVYNITGGEENEMELSCRNERQQSG